MGKETQHWAVKYFSCACVGCYVWTEVAILSENFVSRILSVVEKRGGLTSEVSEDSGL